MADLDLRRMADIPDPFAIAAQGAPPPLAGKALDRSPSRAHVRGLRAAAVAIALLAEVAWLGLVEHRPDLTSVSPSVLVLGVGIPLVAAALALAAATRRGALGLGESTSRLVTLVGLSVAVFAAGTVFAAPRGSVGEADFWGHTLRCMGVTAVLASAPLALGVWSFRHAFVGAPVWRSAALGVAAGALAAATMTLACSTDGALHVLVGHGAMMLVGGAVGATLGRATRA